MDTKKNSAGFSVLSWASLAISSGGVISGLVMMDAIWSVKAFFGMSYVFSISSCFMVAKVIRDKQEEESLIHKVEKAKTQQLINKYVDPVE